MTIFFTSDLHFGHENIIMLAERPFSSLEDMEQALIGNINERVGRNDTLYILGDFSFGQAQRYSNKIRARIECKQVHLIRGNHDKSYDLESPFSTVGDYKELKIEGRKFVLFHFPIQHPSWNGCQRGSIHLHGHIHSKGMEYNLFQRNQGIARYDVGVDANGFYPVSAEEIVEFMAASK